MVGLPVSVSLYLKLACVAPEAIDTLAMLAVSAVLRNATPDGAVDVVDNSTVWVAGAGAALLYASSSCTVIVLEVVPAVRVCAAVVNTSLLAAAGFTVSVCVAVGLARPLSDAVTVGLPA